MKKNLVYLANLSISKLVRWRVLLSEFRFLIQHIPGVQNVAVDGLTRFMSLSSVEIPASKRHLFIEDRIPRIFWFGGEVIRQKSQETLKVTMRREL